MDFSYTHMKPRFYKFKIDKKNINIMDEELKFKNEWNELTRSILVLLSAQNTEDTAQSILTPFVEYL